MFKTHYPKQDFMLILNGFLDSLEQIAIKFISTIAQNRTLDQQGYDKWKDNLEKLQETMSQREQQAFSDVLKQLFEPIIALTPEQRKKINDELEIKLKPFVEKFGENPSSATMLSAIFNQFELYTSKIEMPEIDEAEVTNEDIERADRVQQFQDEHGSIFPIKTSYEQRSIWAVITETQSILEAMIPKLAKREIWQRTKQGQKLATREPHNKRHKVNSPDHGAEYLSSQHYDDWKGYFKGIFGIDISKCLLDQKTYRLLRTLRNAIVHNDGVVTEKIQKELKGSGEKYSVGELIFINTEKAQAAIQCLGTLGINIGIKIIQQYEPNESGEFLFKKLKEITKRFTE
jgi:hypothetical protein